VIVVLRASSSITASRSVSEPGEAGSYEGNPDGECSDTDMPWIVVRVGCFPTVLWLIAKVRGEDIAPPGSVIVARGIEGVRAMGDDPSFRV
jgi:hypothetical protein